MRTQDRLRRLRAKLRAIVGEGKFQIRKDGKLKLYDKGWYVVGRWPDLEEDILSMPEPELKNFLQKALD